MAPHYNSWNVSEPLAFDFLEKSSPSPSSTSFPSSYSRPPLSFFFFFKFFPLFFPDLGLHSSARYNKFSSHSFSFLKSFPNRSPNMLKYSKTCNNFSYFKANLNSFKICIPKTLRMQFEFDVFPFFVQFRKTGFERDLILYESAA